MKNNNYTTTINMHLAVADKRAIYQYCTKPLRQAAHTTKHIMRGGGDVWRQLTLFVEKEDIYIIRIQYL